MAQAELHPELFIKNQNIGRRTCKRIAPMEVLNLFMPRTGAMSIRKSTTSSTPSPTCGTTTSGSPLRAKYNEPPKPAEWWRPQFDQLLSHCMAPNDSPTFFFVEELLVAYPDAKVILVERPFGAWIKSFDVVIEGLFGPGNVIFSFLDPKWMGRLKRVTMGWARGHFHANSAKEMRANSRETYERQYENARKLVPKERLSEYRLGSGWGHCVGFLGKEVPEVEFPRVN
ncbi:uncharacterized protein PAC_19962 [Phialocephala subalpina]|uniref:Uncharacterized protein n=1 Tax=Phialocephala subalpina TaxID=576137 RepID=A0A1L7XYB3_9HELO|nr:uncharacterized protein PAC_19962 [Phialocephala subalpina]